MKNFITLLASLLLIFASFAQEKGSHDFEIGDGINAYSIHVYRYISRNNSI